MANLALQPKSHLRSTHVTGFNKHFTPQTRSGRAVTAAPQAAEKAETRLHAARAWAAVSAPGLSHQSDHLIQSGKLLPRDKTSSKTVNIIFKHSLTVAFKPT